jgi:hypothetical protein
VVWVRLHRGWSVGPGGVCGGKGFVRGTCTQRANFQISVRSVMFAVFRTMIKLLCALIPTVM